SPPSAPSSAGSLPAGSRTARRRCWARSSSGRSRRRSRLRSTRTTAASRACATRSGTGTSLRCSRRRRCRSGPGSRGASASPAGGLLLYTALVVVVLTYSRVGILLSVLVAVVYLVLDERRLETIGVLAVAWIAGAAVAGIGLLLPGIADDTQPHSVRVHDGLLFGLVLFVGAAVVVLALRYLITRAVDARVVRVAAVALAGLVVVALVVSVVRAGGP